MTEGSKLRGSGSCRRRSAPVPLGERGHQMVRRLAPLCIGVVAATGCYAYLPLSAAPTPGTYVSVDLTESASDELARYLGPGIGTLRGRVLSSDQVVLALSVLAVESRGGEIGT